MMDSPAPVTQPDEPREHAPDSARSRGELLEDLARLRAKVASLEAAETECLQATLALRQSEERFRAITTLAPAGIYLTDAGGNCLYVNQRWRRMAGLTLDQALGAGWVAGIHPGDRERVAKEWYDMAATAGNWGLEYRFQTPQGKVTWVYGCATAIKDDAGRVTEYVGVNVDIDERRRADGMLRGITRAVEESPVAIIITDHNGVIQYANPRFTELTGYTTEEAIGQRPGFQKSGQTPPERYTEMWAALRAGQPWKGEFINRKKNGELYLELASISPIVNEAGVVTNFVAIKEDITERRRAEELVAASLKEKEILLREIHHRVKNNLQVIASLVTLQANVVQDPAVLQVLRETQNRIRAMSLIHTKLYQSRDFAQVDFGSFVRDLGVVLLRAYLADPSRVTLEVAAGDIRLHIDSVTPCGLIVNELLANCVRHAFPGARRGHINVDLSQEGDLFRLRVADDGIGFPADLDFRDTPSMGLQLVNLLAEQVGGAVELNRGAGTEFIIAFPAPDRAAEHAPSSQPPQVR